MNVADAHGYCTWKSGLCATIHWDSTHQYQICFARAITLNQYWLLWVPWIGSDRYDSFFDSKLCIIGFSSRVCELLHWRPMHRIVVKRWLSIAMWYRSRTTRSLRHDSTLWRAATKYKQIHKQSLGCGMHSARSKTQLWQFCDTEQDASQNVSDLRSKGMDRWNCLKWYQFRVGVTMMVCWVAHVEWPGSLIALVFIERVVRNLTWLILPVVICLSQRLSHACLRMNIYTVNLRMAH